MYLFALVTGSISLFFYTFLAVYISDFLKVLNYFFLFESSDFKKVLKINVELYGFVGFGHWIDLFVFFTRFLQCIYIYLIKM